MNEKRDNYYKVAAEFGMNMDRAYQIWRRFNTYKTEGFKDDYQYTKWLTTAEIITQLRKEFENDEEVFDFFAAFGLVMITDFMRGRE